MAKDDRTPLLAARAIERRAPLTDAVLLHPTSLDIYAGDCVAVTGSSGAGKSVLLRSLALLDPLYSGEVWFAGKPPIAGEIPEFRAKVAYIRQRPAIFAGNVEDNLRLPFTLACHRQRRFSGERVEQLLAAASRPASLLTRQMRDLSGGELQIIALIRALQLDPAVLLLDEPTSALDPESTTMVETLLQTWASARHAEVASVWITHNPEQQRRMSNRHFVMHAGKLNAAPDPSAEHTMPRSLP